MLVMERLTLQTRHPILTNCSFQFETGKIYGIVARNGSGKTTFFRSVAGLHPVVTGRFILTDNPLGRRNLFYFESTEWLDESLSGTDYLRFIQKEWQSEIPISPILERFHMEDYIHLPIRKYSLGMKQRLLIALYVVSGAQYLLMDEVTNGLDEASRMLFFQTDKL